MSLRSILGRKAFEGSIRVMREGKHIGNLSVSCNPDDDDFDIVFNGASGALAQSSAVTLDSKQFLAFIDKQTEAVKSKRAVSTSTPEDVA